MDLSCGFPPFGRVPSFGIRISECGLNPLFELINFNPKSEICNPKCNDSSRLLHQERPALGAAQCRDTASERDLR